MAIQTECLKNDEWIYDFWKTARGNTMHATLSTQEINLFDKWLVKSKSDQKILENLC